ncbi:hypothetical protein AJ79_05913 [Helicocarpus griseus UAMH5409]|uniref:Uncharacterized protein n=1 Tax=Helicocarpus griseus UAMH5409 TaxID=1447875 RepID=A0A2B7XJ43_9EURO|nr:hypothetical protein AJ79_05913 [Helicocarpus griseus UAMH5409]
MSQLPKVHERNQALHQVKQIKDIASKLADDLKEYPDLYGNLMEALGILAAGTNHVEISRLGPQLEALDLLNEAVRGPLRQGYELNELSKDDRQTVTSLTKVINALNEVVHRDYVDAELEDINTRRVYQNDIERPKLPIKEEAFTGEKSIRRLTLALHDTLHQNWPCRVEGHDHNRRLGHCVEAKLCLDPNWSFRDPDPLHTSFFILLVGSRTIQECRVSLCGTSGHSDTSRLACLVDCQDSPIACLHLITNDKNRLCDLDVRQPPEVLQPEVKFVENSLGGLLEVVKLTDVEKRVLAIRLARSILHLMDGQPIVPIFDKIFLSASLVPTDSEYGTSSKRNRYQIHPFPTILALGTIMMEIGLGDKLSSIYSQQIFTDLKSKGNPFFLAWDLFFQRELQPHFGTGLLSAAQFCIERSSLFEFF